MGRRSQYTDVKRWMVNKLADEGKMPRFIASMVMRVGFNMPSHDLRVKMGMVE